MKCTLPADINQCRFYNKDNMECSNDNECSFQESEEENILTKGYIREERWYEKYYKGSRPKKS